MTANVIFVHHFMMYPESVVVVVVEVTCWLHNSGIL